LPLTEGQEAHLARSSGEARADFNVSISEVGDHDLWGNALVGAAYVTTNSSMAESVLQKVLSLFDEHPEIEVEYEHRDLIR
jgi:uncharacterized protein YlxP (DUF503 family)